MSRAIRIDNVVFEADRDADIGKYHAKITLAGASGLHERQIWALGHRAWNSTQILTALSARARG